MAEGSGGVVRELLAVFNFGVDTKELKKGESNLEDFFGKVKGLAAGLAGAFAVHEIFAFAEAQAHLLDKLDDTAHALGVTTDKVQEYRFASEALGDDADKLLNSMGRLQVAQQAAANGSKAQAAAFEALGVGVKDANGNMKSADELFADVAEGIKGIEDPSKAAAVAVKLFGRGGREILPFLKEGRAGIEGLGEEFRQLGGGYTKEAIEAGAKFEHQMARLGAVSKVVKSSIVTALLPALTSVVNLATKVVKWFADLVKHSNIVKAALITLGAAATYFAVQLAIAEAPIFLMIAAIALLIAVVDEIITTFEGGDTLIRRAVDAMFGEGYTAEHVELLRDAWKAIAEWVRQSYYDFKQFGALIEKYAPHLAIIKGVKSALQWNKDHALMSEKQLQGKYAPDDSFRPSDAFSMQSEGAMRVSGSPLTVTPNTAVTIPLEVTIENDPEKHRNVVRREVRAHAKEDRRHAKAALTQKPVTGQ